MREWFKYTIFYLYEFNMCMSWIVLGMNITDENLYIFSVSLLSAIISYYAYMYIIINSISPRKAKTWWAIKLVYKRFIEGIEEIFNT